MFNTINKYIVQFVIRLNSHWFHRPKLCFKEIHPPSGEVPKPSPLQLRRLFVTSAVPFVAFGLVAETFQRSIRRMDTSDCSPESRCYHYRVKKMVVPGSFWMIEKPWKMVTLANQPISKWWLVGLPGVPYLSLLSELNIDLNNLTGIASYHGNP